MRDDFEVTCGPIVTPPHCRLRWAFALSLSLVLSQPAQSIEAGDQAGTPVPLSSSAPHDASPIRFVTPTDGQAVKGTVSIVIEVVSGYAVDHVSISAGGSTLGVLFAPPYEVTWDTRTEADGPFLLIARARGKDLGEFGAARINVTVDNTPPTITWVSPKDGDLVRATVPLEASPNDLVGVKGVRFLVNGNGVGDVMAPPYVFQWNTEVVPNIRYALEAKVFDRANNTATTTPPVTVRVVNRNRAPAMEPIPPQTVQEGRPMEVAVKAVDADGVRDPLIYSAIKLPAWLHLDAQTGVIHGTPGFSVVPQDPPQLAYKDVRIQVCDPEPLCDSQELRITAVNFNSRPTLQPPGDQTGREGERLTIALVSSDPEADPLACRAINPPQWMTFDPATCALTGVPGPGVANILNPEQVYPKVGFEVCDPEKLCDTKTIAITILDIADRAPIFEALEDKRVDEGKLLFFVVRAHDPDGDHVILESANLPEGSSYSDKQDGTAIFSWTPRLDQSGAYQVTFTATDETLTSSDLVTITVAEKGLTISGVIKDATSRRPLKGATVQIVSPAPERKILKEFTTDERGFYLTSVMPQGVYEVRPGFLLPEFTFALASRRAGGMFFVPPSYPSLELKDHDQTNISFKAYPPRETK